MSDSRRTVRRSPKLFVPFVASRYVRTEWRDGYRIAKGTRKRTDGRTAENRLGSSARQLLDLRQQVLRNFDALRVSRLLGGEAPCAGQPHFRVREHRAHHGVDALEIALHAGERARIDGDERLADARPVPLLREKRVGLRADGGAGERGADEL